MSNGCYRNLDDWISAMGNNEIVGTIFLDLSASFDQGNQAGLLHQIGKHISLTISRHLDFHHNFAIEPTSPPIAGTLLASIILCNLVFLNGLRSSSIFLEMN